MIRGMHGLLYSSDAGATRDFIKNKLRFGFTDTGDGWLIFDVPEGDLGVHPTEHGGKAGDHDLSFYCDDIHGTVADLRARGVEFTQEVAEHGYGLVTHFTIPGGITVQLYEPRYEKKFSAPKRAVPAKKKTARKPAAAKRAKPPARKKTRR